MRDRRIAAALQIADACASADACGDRAAIGREPSDARFLMNGDEVGQRQRPQKQFPARTEALGVADHRQRGRDSLISGAGQDHDRHLAAAHSGIRASRRIGLRLRLDIAVGALEQDPADLGAPAAADALLGDGGIILDLPLQYRLQQRRIDRIGKAHDVLDIQAGFIRQPFLRRRGDRQIEQNFFVSCLIHKIRVVIGDPNAGAVFARPAGKADVQNARRLRAADLDRRFAEIFQNFFRVLLRHLRHHLQSPTRRSGGNSGGNGRLDALQSAGIRHDGAFHVLQNVSADLRPDALRAAAQKLAQLCRRIGNGDRLRTAGRKDQLLLEYGQVCLLGTLVHTVSS